ncbi:hypothetical protein [Anditalea andensis]|uniref:hypothetical protein n=1 Tax=Anditalea andensis TaxID=1048983 RepID=UPI001969A401|nr:hypothetical protein [Anditalea andensis]
MKNNPAITYNLSFTPHVKLREGGMERDVYHYKVILIKDVNADITVMQLNSAL